MAYATFKLGEYVLSTVVTQSKLEALVFIAPYKKFWFSEVFDN